MWLATFHAKPSTSVSRRNSASAKSAMVCASFTQSVKLAHFRNAHIGIADHIRPLETDPLAFSRRLHLHPY